MTIRLQDLPDDRGHEQCVVLGSSAIVRLAALVGLVCVMAACGRGQTPVPAGAQLVHVSVVGSEVRLDPATASCGDIYVVLDTPGSSVGFAQQQRSAEADTRSAD